MTRFALPAALFALAACVPAPASTGAPPQSTATPAPLALTGTKWRFTVIDGNRPVRPDAGLRFDADAIGANVGCNGMGGDYSIEGDTLVAGPIISTQMYCEGIMGQERAVSALLGGKPKLAMAGDRLTITGQDHRAVLVRVK